MNPLTEIALGDLPAIALGAAALGTGGGGDPYIGQLLAAAALRKHGPVRVLAATALQETDVVICVAGMGTPSVLIESPPGPNEFEAALSAVEHAIGKRATAILPAEMGGVNSLIPIQVAAARGLPVIDADGMGRAFPELQMITFNIHGARAAPMAMCAPGGDLVLIRTQDNRQAELLGRQLVVQMGGAVAMALYAMSGPEAARAAIAGTLSLAHMIGAAVLGGREAANPLDALLHALRTSELYAHQRLLIQGKVADVQRRIEGGWTVGECRIEGTDRFRGRSMDLVFRNEFLRAQSDGRTLAIVPDLLMALDADTCEPLTVDALAFGRRISVLGVSAAPIMRTPQALAVFGPSCFGLDEPFIPLESIAEAPPGPFPSGADERFAARQSSAEPLLEK